MSVTIKKIIRDAQGNIVEEYEGSESEVEAYESKRQKKHESAQRKKEILHGKSKKELVKRLAKGDVLEELKKFLTQEMQKLQAIREVHHWHFNNGWWWRPWYYDGGMIYIYSQTAPTSIYNGPVGEFRTTNDVSYLSSQIGVDQSSIGPNNQWSIATTGVSNTNGGILTVSNNGVGSFDNTYTCDTKSVVSGGQSGWSVDVGTVQNLLGFTPGSVN